MHHHFALHGQDIAVMYVSLPLLVRAAWVPSEHVILVDEALDEAGRCEALVELVAAAAAQPSMPAPRRDLTRAIARQRRREAM